MKSPLISIIIPSFNKVKYIERTLKSIVAQSYKNYEVIIQDGGSTDGTLEVIKNYAEKYPRHIAFVSKKDGGQLNAINSGLKKANGEIITYINADDEYTEGAFESVAGHYTENPEALWFAGQGIVINEKGSEIAKLASRYKSYLLIINSYLLILVVNYLMQPSVFLTKKAIKNYGSFTGTKDFVTEYDMWLQLGKVKMPIIINKVISKFRIESGTKTKKMFKKLLTEDEKIIKKFTSNIIVLFLHRFHNLVRIIIERFV